MRPKTLTGLVILRAAVIAGFLSLCLCGADAEASPILYNSGAPNGVYSVSQGYLLADDFILPIDTVLTNISGVEGDSWMLLKGEVKPVQLLFTGPLTPDGEGGYFVPPQLIEAGERYWLGILFGTLSDPCSTSSSFNTTAPNGTNRVMILSYTLGPLGGPGSLFCADAREVPYDFSSPFWTDQGFPPSVTDFSFQLRGESKSIPEPAPLLMLAFGLLAACSRYQRRRRIPPSR
jgi:hypothetical protein